MAELGILITGWTFSIEMRKDGKKVWGMGRDTLLLNTYV